jgi:hypothetical protein
MKDERLVERLRALYPERDTTNWDWLDFMYAEGSPVLALWYSRLFWPEFVEVDGMVFLKESMESEDDRRRLKEAIERYGGDRKQVEQSFNRVEVEDLFTPRADDASDEDYEVLVRRIAEMWRSKLRQQFPDRRFVVEVLAEVPTTDELSVMFYQQPTPS